MERLLNESKPDYYTVYRDEAGQKYVVLDGLENSQPHTPGVLESFMLSHYDTFALAYWGLLLATFVYLIGTYLVIPLYLRVSRGLPFFSEQ